MIPTPSDEDWKLIEVMEFRYMGALRGRDKLSGKPEQVILSDLCASFRLVSHLARNLKDLAEFIDSEWPRDALTTKELAAIQLADSIQIEGG